MKQMLVALVLMLVSGTSGAAAGFDCAKASTVDEHIVCDVPQLSQLDSLLQPAYLEAKAALPDENVPRMARDFLADRHACAADRACILSTYLGALDGYNDLGATVDIPLISPPKPLPAVVPGYRTQCRTRSATAS
ncbi:hypothetical protein LP421_24945 [Rhizobium sp. RCAM05350]|nr:hypothetical protein LP421_24945 [Rhizobium sp. RCAM05350]